MEAVRVSPLALRFHRVLHKPFELPSSNRNLSLDSGPFFVLSFFVLPNQHSRPLARRSIRRNRFLPFLSVAPLLQQSGTKDFRGASVYSPSLIASLALSIYPFCFQTIAHSFARRPPRNPFEISQFRTLFITTEGGPPSSASSFLSITSRLPFWDSPTFTLQFRVTSPESQVTGYPPHPFEYHQV